MEWSKMAWLASGLLVAVGLGVVVVRASFAGKYEEPDYTVVQQTETLEVRDYGPRLLAEVTMGTDRDSGANTGFRTLAAYIFSSDTPEGAPIGMTVPVGQYESDEGTWRMWFVMPSRYTVDNLPPPNDPRIRILERAPERLAVRSMSGRMDRANFSEDAEKLEADARAAGLEPIGPATLAVYNGPFTPGPFRRNEVMLPVRVTEDP